jgi:hypothetical protein
LWAFYRALRGINDDDLPLQAALTQLLFAGQMKLGDLEDHRLDSMHDATHCGFRELPRHGNMKIGTIFPPVL